MCPVRRSRPAVLLTLFLAASPARAAIILTAETGNQPELFGSGMVLQREATVPVWGRTDAGTEVRVDLTSPGGVSVLQSKTATATTPSGRFVVRFTSLPVGGPYELRFYENAAPAPSVTLTEVLVGDVWLLSGQSNMQLIRTPLPGDLESHPDVRTLGWKHWGQQPAGAAFYFGVQLSDALGVPIGLVNRARSDSALRQWLPPEIASDADPYVAANFPGCGADPLFPYCQCYEEFIRPVERVVEPGDPREAIALRGIVWWQGEKGEDKREPERYAHMFQAMIRTWRANFGQPDLAFVYHQLPSGGGLKWTDLRAKSLPRTNDLRHWLPRQRIAYFRALDVPFTSLMSSIDLDSGTHPRDFDLYGRRLGDAALGTTYVESGDVALYPYSGPIYESAAPEASGRVRIRFRAGTADGLQAGPGTEPPASVVQGFAVCCDTDSRYVWADAAIENGDEVVVSSPFVAAPTAVQYGLGRSNRWANLFNGDQRGAVPFSTEPEPFVAEDDDADGFWEPGAY